MTADSAQSTLHALNPLLYTRLCYDRRQRPVYGKVEGDAVQAVQLGGGQRNCRSEGGDHVGGASA